MTHSTSLDHGAATLAPSGGAALLPIEPGQMWVDGEFLPTLERAGLARFDAVMSTQTGKLLRALPQRENWRLDLDDGRPRPVGMYLKKHRVRSWGYWLRARLGAAPAVSSGRVEAFNIASLEQTGIDAMRLVAYGEKLHADGLLESFVLTQELAGHLQLDRFLRERFDRPAAGRRSTPDHHLSALLQAVAAVAARFHDRGFNHRDLYCCHFFIHEPAPGQFQVNLIDLQRVERRRWFRHRWVIKDLAQLAYSAPRDRISRTRQMAFIKRYLGVRRLQPIHKRLIRAVLAKCRGMQRRLGDHP